MQKSPSTSIHLFENINGKMQDSDASSYTTETTFESEFTHSSVNSSESSNHTAIEILGLEILSDHSHFSNSDENSSMVSFLEVDSLKLTRKEKKFKNKKIERRSRSQSGEVDSLVLTRRKPGFNKRGERLLGRRQRADQVSNSLARQTITKEHTVAATHFHILSTPVRYNSGGSNCAA